MVDLILIDRIYVNDNNFVDKKALFAKPKTLDVDRQILADKTLHFRVLDMTAGERGGRQANPFTSNEGAHYHKIVGGYHAAKPRLFQDIAETYLQGMEMFTDYLHILGMMNVRYITQAADVKVANPEVLGNSWFVEAIDLVETADEELAALPALTPRVRAVTRKSNEAYLQGLDNSPTQGDYIILKAYHPEKLTYESKAGNERFAVFSEIYYPSKKGWNVYIDGQKVPEGFVKVNYLLRGMRVPAGQHTIEMRFEPRSFYTGETIALISSLLVMAVLAIGLFFYYKEKTKEETPEDDLYEEDNLIVKTSVEPESIKTETPEKTESQPEKPKNKKKGKK